MRRKEYQIRLPAAARRLLGAVKQYDVVEERRAELEK